MEKEILASIDAAAGKQESVPEEGKPAQAPAPTESAIAQPKEKAVTQPALNEKSTEEWDGNVNSLPSELQSWAKKAQAVLTKKAMAESELRKKGQEYTELLQSDDWKKFQDQKNQPQPNSTQESAPAQESGITQEEWEAAQLDLTGKVANQLIQREIQRKIEAAAQQYGMAVNSLAQKAEIAEFKSTLAEFTDMHPDIQELYEDGLIEPLLNEELKSGKHKSHDSAIKTAYERSTAIREKSDSRALAKSQGRIAEKKGSVVSTGTSTGELSTVEVPKSDVFQKAFEAAIQGKKLNVKAKR